MDDLEYIRYLMLYSDQKYPYKKAKADPGLGESFDRSNNYMKKHGNTRKLSHEEANRILLNEKNGRMMVRDIDEEYTPKAEKQLQNIEQMFTESVPKPSLENEIEMLKKQLAAKEQELKARSNPPSNNEGFTPRNLKDTGYSDKINDNN